MHKSDSLAALTEPQAGIWLGQQLHPQSPIYNAAEAIEINGPLDIAVFNEALTAALAEASGLQLGNSPQRSSKKIHNNSTERPRITSLDVSDRVDPLNEALAQVHNDVLTPIDIHEGFLDRYKLFTLGENHYLWSLCIHHIVADGYAFALLVQRVVEIYNETFARLSSSAGPKTRGFGDYQKYLADDIKYRSSARWQRDKTFWSSYLRNAQNAVSFSSSNAPMGVQKLQERGEINANIVEKTTALAQSLRVTWAEVLLALVAASLYKQTGAKSIVLGLPVMCRLGSVALRVPAMVMNIIPLVVAIESGDTFSKLCTKIAAQISLTRPHSRYRYENMRRDLKRVGGGQRLFGPVVNIMPFDRSANFFECDTRLHSISAGPVDDISFSFIMEPGSRLAFHLDANAERYDSAQTNALFTALPLQLNTFINQPNSVLSVDLAPLSWLETPALDAPLADVTASIYTHIRNRSHDVAVTDLNDNITWNYRELGDATGCLAGALASHGVVRGGRVVIALPRGRWAISCLLACLFYDCSFTFLDPNGPSKRACEIVADLAPDLVICETGREQDYWYATKTVSLATLHTAPYMPLRAVVHEQQTSAYTNPLLAYLIYTSGSTGVPKGVRISRKALNEFTRSAIACYRVGRNERVLQFSPLHFDACIEEIFIALCTGSSLIIRSENMLSATKTFLDGCEQHKISILDLPTAYWHELVYSCVTQKLTLPPTVTKVIIGGEAALPERVAQWHQLTQGKIELLNTYGPSEATVVASCQRLLPGREVTIGTPLPGRCLAVIDSCGHLVRRGEQGELVIAGEGVGEGYHNLASATEMKFKKGMFAWCEKNARAYLTGDSVRINTAGELEYLGRIDNEIKISGHRINPLEIENALTKLLNSAEVAVIAPKNSEGSVNLIACISSQKTFSVQTLRSVLHDRFPAVMIPTSVINLEALPKNTAGKIDLQALYAMAKTERNNGANPLDLSPLERIVIDVWQQVLGVSSINVSDDFFMLGGQSLQTIQVSNRLSAALNTNVAVDLLFQYPTVSSLVDALTKTPSGSYRVMSDVLQTDSYLNETALPHLSRGDKPKSLGQWENVLLTGASGFVGVQLLASLLRESSATIHCLVRAKSVNAAHQKILAAAQQQGVHISLAQERIAIVLGDLEKPELGLQYGDYVRLQQSLDAIIHNGASTSVMRDYQSLKATNLDATLSLLKLTVGRNIPFHYISTIAVGPSHNLPEAFLPWHGGLVDGYQQSKWASENALAVAASRGYPVSVYRLGRVVGDVSTGFVNAQDLMWNIVRASAENGSYPTLTINEPWTQVHQVANAIINIAATQTNGVFNLVPKHRVGLQQLIDVLNSNAIPSLPASLLDWCAILEKSQSEKDQALAVFFKQRIKAGVALVMPEIETTKTDMALANNCEYFSQIDKAGIERYLQYTLSSGLISPACVAVRS